MRLTAAALGGVLLATAGSAGAQELRRPAASPAALPGFLSEFRIGGSAQDPWGAERGTGNLTGEILLAKPFTPADLFTSYFVPRPHFGASLNFDHRTSFAYTGLTWTVDLSPRVFVEGGIGAAVHDGRTNPFGAATRSALGCAPLFRESGSVGVRLSANWSLMASVERLENGGLCAENKGLTNVGARLGYTF